MHFDVVTLFPSMFDAIEQYGVVGNALQKKILDLKLWNPRDFCDDNHKTVDDRPYGGGPGMVMKPEPLVRTIDAIKQEKSASAPVIYLTPAGEKLDFSLIKDLAKCSACIMICGRYEGLDERIIDTYVDRQISLGDYVLSGGELAAMVIIDAVARHVPEVLGHEDSASQDSFCDMLLEAPHYTRPELFKGSQVPAVLLSGNHEAIARWRLKNALGRTFERRPDLLQSRGMNKTEQLLLEEYLQEKIKNLSEPHKKDS